MRLPTIQGIIRRRILANFKIDPEVMQRQLPNRFRPKLHNGFAVAGICLIRLEDIRPRAFPSVIGISSENAAHRVAVLWEEQEETHEGVFIARRDTNSPLNYILGGRVFPGEHHKASFAISENDNEISLSMRSDDAAIAVDIAGRISEELPATSIFDGLLEASSFFEGGSLGYSVTRDTNRLDGLRLQTNDWRVEPLEIDQAYSSYFSDGNRFPEGSVAFDHALIMRNIAHEWHTADDLYV